VLLRDLHRAIGLGGDHMVERFAGDVDAPVEDWWHEEFQPLMAELRPTPGAAALVATLGRSGTSNVYATSGRAEDVTAMRELIGADEWISAAVSSSEVASSKPAPDIFELAMRRVGAGPSRTIVIGDSTWDIEAAAAAGLACIAVTCGGTGAAELTAAGAVAVYETPRDLLDHLGESPLHGVLG